MGVSSPSIGYSGYIASDDILDNHDTEYTATTSSSTVMAEFRVLQDMDPYSKLRLKVSIKNTGSGGTYTRVYVYLDGVCLGYMQESGVNYVEHSMDRAMSDLKRGSMIKFVLHQSVSGTGYGKLIKICGKISPVVLE